VEITIYTDGSCRPNPGPGGWAAILRAWVGCANTPDASPYITKEVSGGDPDTTINRMELTAVLEGLKAITKPCQVTIVTDSQNVIGWLSQNWKRNDDAVIRLGAEIDLLIAHKNLTVSFEKVKSHSGHEMNDLADHLAKAAIPC
jgi:ribonuclease HI